jgi:hypothetical protein
MKNMGLNSFDEEWQFAIIQQHQQEVDSTMILYALDPINTFGLTGTTRIPRLVAKITHHHSGIIKCITADNLHDCSVDPCSLQSDLFPKPETFYSNMNGRKLRCSNLNNIPWFMTTRGENGELHPTGFDAKLLTTIGKSLNFRWLKIESPDHQPSSNDCSLCYLLQPEHIIDARQTVWGRKTRWIFHWDYWSSPARQ